MHYYHNVELSWELYCGAGSSVVYSVFQLYKEQSTHEFLDLVAVGNASDGHWRRVKLLISLLLFSSLTKVLLD
jgi:hypothetical protein